MASGAFRSLFMLSVLLCVGMALIAIRWLVIANSHGIARHANTYASILTMLFNAVEVIIDIIIGALVVAIKAIVDGINMFGGHVNFDPHAPKFHPVSITTEEIENLFNDLPARCETYDNAFAVMRHAMRGWLHDIVCPVIRATWPIPWLWDVTNGALGWMSYDARPTGAWVIAGTPGNCEAPDSTDWFCAGLASGFVLVELLVPLVVIAVASPLLGPAFSLGTATLKKRQKNNAQIAPAPEHVDTTGPFL